MGGFRRATVTSATKTPSVIVLMAFIDLCDSYIFLLFNARKLNQYLKDNSTNGGEKLFWFQDIMLLLSTLQPAFYTLLVCMIIWMKALASFRFHPIPVIIDYLSEVQGKPLHNDRS